ncbi:MAG: hypothetical protein QXF15_03830 [Candidatus Aenigmatarchaeota archaeon]
MKNVPIKFFLKTFETPKSCYRAAKELGLSYTDVLRRAKKMEKLGYLEKAGEIKTRKKGYYYVLSEQGKAFLERLEKENVEITRIY